MKVGADRLDHAFVGEEKGGKGGAERGVIFPRC